MVAASVVSAVAQVPDPVIGVTFNKSGIVLGGSDADNHTAGKSTNLQELVYCKTLKQAYTSVRPMFITTEIVERMLLNKDFTG